MVPVLFRVRDKRRVMMILPHWQIGLLSRLPPVSVVGRQNRGRPMPPLYRRSGNERKMAQVGIAHVSWWG